MAVVTGISPEGSKQKSVKGNFIQYQTAEKQQCPHSSAEKGREKNVLCNTAINKAFRGFNHE